MRALLPLALAPTLLAACHGAEPKLARPAGPEPEAGVVVSAELAELNRKAREGASSDRIGGLEVFDPYRALELDSPETRAWIAAQSARTERELEPFREAAAEARIRQLLSIGTVSEVALSDARVFFMAREGERQRPALYAFDLATPARGGRALPDEPLLDPASYGEHSALDYAYPSPDGRYVAFGVSEKGDERATLRVLDVDERRVLTDTLPHAKWSSVSWLHDGSGFYYTRYPRPGEADYDEAAEDTYFSRLFFHRLGEPPERDELVFSGERPTDFPSALLDEHDRYLVLHNHRSWTASDVFVWDRAAAANTGRARPQSSEMRPVIAGEDQQSSALVREGMLYLLTNVDAPRKRIVRVPLSDAGDRSKWQEVVAESSATLRDMEVLRDHLVVHSLDDVQSKLAIFSLTGEPRGEIPLPTAGAVASLAGNARAQRVAFVWSSYFHPPALYVYDLQARRLERLYEVKSDFDASAFELSRARVPSKDGTLVNVFYASRRDRPRDGNAPVLLRGYGGFDISLLPQFARGALHFMERGGIYAEANLRGGGELGEAWHRAGMRENKVRVFEDFEAVVRWFHESGLSRPSRIAITGGSNGGLLMGALVTRAPETFAAAASYVGLYDMLRYPRFPPAALWTSEYGDPEDPAMAPHLLAYSPYHNVRSGRAYPAVLIETADHDTRVFWGHSTKFAARLQEASVGARPIYFFMEREVGHGRGTGLDALVRREARKHAFLRKALGLEAHDAR